MAIGTCYEATTRGYQSQFKKTIQILYQQTIRLKPNNKEDLLIFQFFLAKQWAYNKSNKKNLFEKDTDKGKFFFLKTSKSEIEVEDLIGKIHLYSGEVHLSK